MKQEDPIAAEAARSVDGMKIGQACRLRCHLTQSALSQAFRQNLLSLDPFRIILVIGSKMVLHLVHVGERLIGGDHNGQVGSE